MTPQAWVCMGPEEGARTRLHHRQWPAVGAQGRGAALAGDSARREGLPATATGAVAASSAGSAVSFAFNKPKKNLPAGTVAALSAAQQPSLPPSRQLPQPQQGRVLITRCYGLGAKGQEVDPHKGEIVQKRGASGSKKEKTSNFHQPAATAAAVPRAAAAAGPHRAAGPAWWGPQR